MTVYLDASVLVPLIVPEPASPAADLAVANANAPLAVSDFAAAEVASALSRLVRMRQLSIENAAVALATFDEWRAISAEPLELASADVRLADHMVRRFELMLRTPDALHAAICRRLGLTLVTFDRRLAAAARNLGVEVAVSA